MFHKKLTPHELGELRAIERLIREEKLKLALVKGNTLLVPKGQAWVRTQEGILSLLESQREIMINKISAKFGFEEGEAIQLDLETGKIWKKPSNES